MFKVLSLHHSVILINGIFEEHLVLDCDVASQRMHSLMFSLLWMTPTYLILWSPVAFNGVLLPMSPKSVLSALAPSLTLESPLGLLILTHTWIYNGPQTSQVRTRLLIPTSPDQLHFLPVQSILLYPAVLSHLTIL